MKLVDMPAEQQEEIIRNNSDIQEKLSEYLWDSASDMIEEYLDYISGTCDYEIDYSSSHIWVNDERQYTAFLEGCFKMDEEMPVLSEADSRKLVELFELSRQLDSMDYDEVPEGEYGRLEDGITEIAGAIASYLQSYYEQAYDLDYQVEEYFDYFFDVAPFDELEVDDNGEVYQVIRKVWK